MPHHEKVVLAGVIQHVFAHRFTLLAHDVTYLADLGPKGADAFPLEQGLAVRLKGERRPSELKVVRIAAEDGAWIEVEHRKPHHGPRHAHPDLPAEPAVVVAAAQAAGWTIRGEPERKPRHFELAARRGRGAWTELHVDFSGVIYKEKPADAEKWKLPG